MRHEKKEYGLKVMLTKEQGEHIENKAEMISSTASYIIRKMIIDDMRKEVREELS